MSGELAIVEGQNASMTKQNRNLGKGLCRLWWEFSHLYSCEEVFPLLISKHTLNKPFKSVYVNLRPFFYIHNAIYTQGWGPGLSGQRSDIDTVYDFAFLLF